MEEELKNESEAKAAKDEKDTKKKNKDKAE